MHLIPITPDMVIRAYAAGIFPMAESRDDPTIHWIDPRHRGIIPIDDFHIPRSLRKLLRKRPFTLRCDTAFEEVIAGCAEVGYGTERDETWINPIIEDVFVDLHAMGHAHSVEVFDDQDRLVGGLYGLALNGAFFGESMFSRAPNASKIALCHLIAVLRTGGFSLLDTQFVNEHLIQFGVREIPRAAYHAKLARALDRAGVFHCAGVDAPSVLLDGGQSSNQTS